MNSSLKTVGSVKEFGYSAVWLLLFLSASAFGDCKLYYASRIEVEKLRQSNQEIKALSASVNNVLKSSFEILNKVDHATLGLMSAIVTRGHFSFDDLKPSDWEKMSLVGQVVFQESAFTSVPLRGAKLILSEGKTERTVTTGTNGEFAEYFYKIVPYRRLRLFPSLIIDFRNETQKSIGIPIEIKLESKTCMAHTRLTEVPLDTIVLVATTQ